MIKKVVLARLRSRRYKWNKVKSHKKFENECICPQTSIENECT